MTTIPENARARRAPLPAPAPPARATTGISPESRSAAGTPRPGSQPPGRGTPTSGPARPPQDARRAGPDPSSSRPGRSRGAGAGSTPGTAVDPGGRAGVATSGNRPGRAAPLLGARPGQHTLSAGQAAIAAAMSEDRSPDSLDAHVRKLMADLGLWGHHIERSLDLDTGRTNVSRKGWPDWTILGPHGGLFRELKAEDGKPSKEQRDVGARLSRAGFDWDIWKPSDLLSGRIQRELTAIAGIGRAA